MCVRARGARVMHEGALRVHVCICMCRRAYACQTKKKEIFWGMDGEDA
jgi:hypothetical protein